MEPCAVAGSRDVRSLEQPPCKVKPGPRPHLQIPAPPDSLCAVSHDDCLRTRGTILKRLENDLHEVALPNGKPVICHFSKELAENPPELADGAEVMLEISPFDLDRGRIAGVG